MIVPKKYSLSKGTLLKLGDALLPLEERISVVGAFFDFNGNDGLAMEHWIAQATKVFYKWCLVLQCSSVSLVSRMHLLAATAFSAVLWLAETWHPTVCQASRMESWAARLAGRVARVCPDSTEDAGSFWRRWHRTGHNLMLQNGGGVVFRMRRRLHSFAGHLARSPDKILSCSLRTRGLAWWRAVQVQGLFPHPGRFKAWRWEEQLEKFYGRNCCIFTDVNSGWMLQAQNRSAWKISETSFAHAS